MQAPLSVQLQTQLNLFVCLRWLKIILFEISPGLVLPRHLDRVVISTRPQLRPAVNEIVSGSGWMFDDPFYVQ